ncbi:pentapeptide repeat-containing protein [Nanoarchaeota archaeon]
MKEQIPEIKAAEGVYCLLPGQDPIDYREDAIPESMRVIKGRSKADFERAYLEGVDFNGLNLSHISFRNANIRGGNFVGADLLRTDFTGADLTGSCLDPMNVPNGDVKDFERDPERDGFLIGFRSRRPIFTGGKPYEIRETYTTPVFSSSSESCHPGLYVFPTVETVDDFLSTYFSMNQDLVKVVFRPEDCHRAGNKWRVRQFDVVGSVIARERRASQ